MSGPFLDLGDVVRDQTVGLTVNRGRCLLARRVNEAEHLARPLVEPVLQVLDAVPVLNLQISLVGARDRFRGQSVKLVMVIHEEWHPMTSWSCGRLIRMAAGSLATARTIVSPA